MTFLPVQIGNLPPVFRCKTADQVYTMLSYMWQLMTAPHHSSEELMRADLWKSSQEERHSPHAAPGPMCEAKQDPQPLDKCWKAWSHPGTELPDQCPSSPSAAAPLPWGPVQLRESQRGCQTGGTHTAMGERHVATSGGDRLSRKHPHELDVLLKFDPYRNRRKDIVQMIS